MAAIHESTGVTFLALVGTPIGDVLVVAIPYENTNEGITECGSVSPYYESFLHGHEGIVTSYPEMV